MYARLSVTCHLQFGQNDWGLFCATVVTREWSGHWVRVSTQSWLWRRKFSQRSCQDSNLQHFDHESGALTNKLSWLPAFYADDWYNTDKSNIFLLGTILTTDATQANQTCLLGAYDTVNWSNTDMFLSDTFHTDYWYNTNKSDMFFWGTFHTDYWYNYNRDESDMCLLSTIHTDCWSNTDISDMFLWARCVLTVKLAEGQVCTDSEASWEQVCTDSEVSWRHVCTDS